MSIAQTRKEYNFSNFNDAASAWPQERWENEGRPHIWITAETQDGYEVQVDKAYGGVRLLIGNEIVAVGNTMLTYSHTDATTKVEIVVLDKEYYCVSKYLWF